MNTTKLPQEYVARRYGPLGIDTIKLRFRAEDVNPAHAMRPQFPDAWKLNLWNNNAGWQAHHPGLDVFIEARLQGPPGRPDHLRIDITASVATLATWTQTGLALNLTPVPVKSAQEALKALTRFVLETCCGLAVTDADLDGIAVIRLDVFADIWVSNVAATIRQLSDLRARVARTKNRGTTEFLDGELVSRDHESFTERRTGIPDKKGASGNQDNRGYNRDRKVKDRVAEKWKGAAEVRKRILADPDFRFFIKQQVRLEAEHGQNHADTCRHPRAEQDDHFPDGGAKRFKGKRIKIGNLSDKLVQTIFQGRLQEKGLGPNSSGFVVCQGDAEFISEATAAGASRGMACQMIVLSKMSDEVARDLGFKRRKLEKDFREKIKKTILLGPKTKENVGDLLWKASKAAFATAPFATDIDLQELQQGLVGAVQGTTKRRQSRTRGASLPHKPVTIDFLHDGWVEPSGTPSPSTWVPVVQDLGWLSDDLSTA